MNVMINDISEDLDTTVQGVQTAITIFLLVMAALMIPGGKLTDTLRPQAVLHARPDRLRHRRPAERGLPRPGVLILGNSILEGVGTALLIPPVYILTTLLFTDISSRARAFGAISGLGGIGAAAGPLIGGLITTAHQLAGRVRLPGAGHRRDRRAEPPHRGPAAGRSDSARSTPVGAVLSAVGLVLVVSGILAADDNVWLMLGLIVGGRLVPGLVLPLRARQGAGRQGTAAVDVAVPQPDVQPRPGHAERPVAGAHGRVVRRLGVPAGRAGLQRDRDRRDLHRRHGRPAADVVRRRAVREAARAADAHHGRLRRHDRRHRRLPRHGEQLAERLGVRARAASSSASASA